MKIKSISIALFILLASLVIFSCKNAANTENNNENNTTEEKTESSNDSLNTKIDTTLSIDTLKTDNIKPNKAVCYYCDDPILDIYFKLNGKVRSIEMTLYTDFIEKNGTILPNLESNYSQYLYQQHFKPDGKRDWTDMYRNSGGAYIYTYSYDSLDRASVKYMKYFGSDSTKIICSYNDNNNTKTETYLENDNYSVLQKYLYTYDDNKNLILVKLLNDSGKVISKEDWQYDENSNITYNCKYGYKNDTMTYQIPQYYYYVFDGNNNWTMKYNYTEDKELSSITVRKITYY